MEVNGVDEYTQRPLTLYELGVNAFCRMPAKRITLIQYHQQLYMLPPRILVDIFEQFCERDDLRDYVFAEMADIHTFMRLLQNGIRLNMIAVIAKLVNHSRHLPCHISITYRDRVDHMLGIERSETTDRPPGPSPLCIGTAIKHTLSDIFNRFTSFGRPTTFKLKVHRAAIWYGLSIGAFLVEGGWWHQAIVTLRATMRVITSLQQHTSNAPGDQAQKIAQLQLTQLQCYARLLHAEARYIEYPAANASYAAGAALFKRIGAERVPRTLRTMWYLAVSVQYGARSDHANSHRWGVLAVQELQSGTPAKLVVDVLRQTAKSCVLSRQFERARMLLMQAIKVARSAFGVSHHKYADALMDYAYYLLNADSMETSVWVYKDALRVRTALLGNYNLLVALAQEDLAYALYVHNYSSGDFASSQSHVEKAIKILRHLVPATHMFLSSAKRVKALVLEELALEQVQGSDVVNVTNNRQVATNRLLLEAEELHYAALRLSLDTFGVDNVQTAKHYGNLGRLYQSMTKFEDAERMQSLAIKIKTDILGPCDFEVGLSIGHLASLYNYHMNRYRDAEVLYLRSIAINLRLFDDAYSGLEYDYRGLVNVYEMLDDVDKCFQYQTLLELWRHRRADREEPPIDICVCGDDSLEEMTRKFFEMNKTPAVTSTTNTTEELVEV